MKINRNKKLKSQKLYIKNMVCDRCIRVVRDELQLLGHDVRYVELGEVELGNTLKQNEMDRVKSMLQKNGFELIEDKNGKTIEAIKMAIIQLVHHNHNAEPMKLKYSDYIAKKVGKDYHSLSTLFSSVENVTIEHYIIKQKIERVKELLKYDDRSLSEIAYVLNYSSVQHLSNQFKTITGFTPSQFKKQKPAYQHLYRISLDKVK
ncbi:MAG TPA: AraC family transcriptional regulator [Bacteroidetes bacterium]|nr:AraC family transcriptional regulator [Bacteroidota bacterium]